MDNGNSKPKIMIIIGSPRKYGACSKLAAIASKGVIDAGGVVEKIFLYDYKIKPCIGCVSDDIYACKFPCIIEDDDFNMIGEKILESNGFIIVTPIYWYSVSGVLKNFIDRMTSFENMIFHSGRSLLEGKIAGFIASGNDSGGIHVIAYLMVTLNSMGVHIPAWALAYSHEREDVLKDEQAIKDSYNVGYIVAKTAYILRDIKEWYQPGIDPGIMKEISLSEINKYITQKVERKKMFHKTMSRPR